MEELDGFLEHLSREVHDPAYAGLLERLISDHALRAALAPRAVHPQRPPCLPRRAVRAHRRGRRSWAVETGRAARAAELRPAAVRGARPRPRQDARVHLRRRDLALTRKGRLLGHVALGQRMLDERTAGMDEGKRLALAHCVLCHHGPDAWRRDGGSAPPRRSRSTGSTRSTLRSRAHWNTGSTSGTKVRRGVHHSVLPQLRPLSVGEVLDASFKIVRQSFGTLAGCVLVVALPLNIVSTFVTCVDADLHPFNSTARE